MEPFETSEQLVDAVAERADDSRTLAYGPGGRPVVAARAGGDRTPGIVLTAGAHATEQAGVTAAVELLDRLETDREVHVIPTRDPLGVDGYAAALSEALGRPVTVESPDQVADLLRAESTVVFDEDDIVVGQIGDLGFGTARPTAEKAGWKRGSDALSDHLESSTGEPLRGRRVFFISGHPDVEGTGETGRLYTRVVTPHGENLHLNRFIGSEWAPSESRAVRDLLQEVDPGLFVDLHEYGGDDYWVSVRPMADDQAQERAREVGRAMTDEIARAGGDLLPLADHIDADPADHFFSEVENGLWNLDYRTRGEGFNATDYAAEHGALAFTNETGMYRPFDERVEMAVRSVERAVAEFERLER